MQLSDRIGRRLKLQDLHVLMTVVQAGSMGKAAERLNTSQPNVSRSIADLEHAIGVRLLDRQSRGVEPTASGRALLDCGLAVFDDLRQGIKSIEHLADPTTGELRIGSSYFLAASFVPAVIERLSKRFPRITFHVVTGDGRANLRKLQERDLDLLVAWKSPPYVDEQLAFEHLYEDCHVIVAGANHRFARRHVIKLTELLNEPWILTPPESDLGPIGLGIFSAAGLDIPRATISCFSTDVRLNFLSSGHFLTLCPTSILRFPKRRTDVKILPVAVHPTKVAIGIFTLKKRSSNPVVQLFVEHARKFAKLLRTDNK